MSRISDIQTQETRATVRCAIYIGARQDRAGQRQARIAGTVLRDHSPEHDRPDRDLRSGEAEIGVVGQFGGALAGTFREIALGQRPKNGRAAAGPAAETSYLE